MSAAIERMRRWHHEPWVFAREALGITPDAWQDEVLKALPGNQRVCLCASKGPGKSGLLAMIGLWYLSTRPHPKCVATSISADNLRDNLWSEFAKWMMRSKFLSHTFKWSAERIFAKEHPETWWISARAWSKTADKGQQADTLAGIHADHVLFLIDEAGGVPDSVAVTAEAGLANASQEHGREAKLIIAGNPTQLSGPLYRATTTERDLWWVKNISGDPDDPNRAPRVSPEWAREQIRKFGRDNPWVLVNVFGRFPPAQSNALIALHDALAALKRSAAGDMRGVPKILGVDVARFGDDESVLALRQGQVLFEPKRFRNLSLMELVSKVTYSIEEHRPDAVFIDQTGMGAGVVDRLRELKYSVIGVDFGGSAGRPERYVNKRCEMWGLMGEWVKSASIPSSCEELARQMAEPTYTFTPKGQLWLESKKDLKARGKDSPDIADAVALTFAQPVAAPQPATGDRKSVKVQYDWNPLE